MRRFLIGAALVLAAGAFIVIAGGASNGPTSPTYKIALDNAFGLTSGEDFKVAGVPAGTIQSISLDQKTLHAIVTVQITQSGFGQFHPDATCESRPQSLIGEYFIDCDPGHSGPALRSGATIPVSHTTSTIPADLLTDVMRMPYRQRLTLIINELGAGVASRSEDLQAALQRAVPALTETDNLLSVLANDSHTLQDLTTNSNHVITALADNSAQVQRFIVEANNAATDTATQQAALQSTFQKLPGFLEQLRPTLAQLGAAVDANEPVLSNLNAASGQIDRLLSDLPPFSRSARPALKSLGQASVTGSQAVQAATPTVAALNAFAQPTPELAQNLSIVLRDLDDRSRAVTPDPRSPGGKGYTGLEALLQYAFNQTLAINTFGPYGHMLAVDAFVSAMCSPYATPQTIADNLKSDGPAYRQCYSWLGPNQIGVNEPDPSNPGACVPDPGGAPPGEPGPATSACRLAAAGSGPSARAAKARRAPHAATRSPSPSAAPRSAAPAPPPASHPSAPGRLPSLPINVGKTVGQVLSTVLGSAPAGTGAVACPVSSTAGSVLSKLLGSSSAGSPGSKCPATQSSPSNTSSPSPSSGSSSGASPPSGSGGSSGGQAKQLLNYLLAP